MVRGKIEHVPSTSTFLSCSYEMLKIKYRDINEIYKEVNYIKKVSKHEKINLFGSLLIPSKQFIARFKFRPWKGVYISEKFLGTLDAFHDFTGDLVNFYINNNITPVIESDFSSSEKLDSIYSFFRK